MATKTLDCVYCHATLAGKQHADPVHPHVCDGCMESIRTKRRPLGVPQPTDLEPPPKGTRPWPKTKAKSK
jgi:hypothetical protein